MVIQELGKVLGNQTFARCIWRLEMLLKRIITPKTTDIINGKRSALDYDKHTIRKNFICDSHPAICIVCGHIRTYLRFRKFPKKLSIMTKTGPYVWIKEQTRTYHLRGAPNFRPLNGKSIIEWDQAVLRDDLVCLTYLCRQFYQHPINDELYRYIKFKLEVQLPRNVPKKEKMD